MAGPASIYNAWPWLGPPEKEPAEMTGVNYSHGHLFKTAESNKLFFEHKEGASILIQ